MKKKLILSLALISGMLSALCAQNPVISTKYSDKEITTLIQNYKKARHHDVWPDDILQKKNQQDFSYTANAEWETDNEIYEADFEIKFRDFEAFYDKEGNLLMYKKEIHEKEIPAIVKTAAESKYPKFSFEDIQKIVKGTETFYKIEMEFKDTEVTVLVTNEGKLISEKVDY